MTVSPVDFASLLCSRLCHDLLSPVGALNNGLELLADETDPAMRARCMELLADSARASASKLKFFRLAFGAAGGFGEEVATREAKSAVEGLIAENKRIELAWLVDEETMPKAAIKVLLNLVLIGGESLVRGGRMEIGGEDNAGHLEVVVKVEGPRLVLDPEIRRTLVDGPGDTAVTPRAAAAYMVHTLVAESGGSMQIFEPSDGVMIFGAVFNAR
ncbi:MULTISPECIES: histidine phosphotransferase family protein [Sphingomonas]|uniref:histidine phosphotransferase family protein n=1 Tax=Sphingomonas TaxID=13687 RepID=UPI00070046E9|nr:MULTISPECIES: histidine phosphotransferase family protein [Sphingomonas]KQM99792.1 histidine phosphotransferase [Sphingomonas sp. Leaf226]MDY0965782.1 histidine phosphotransferase family protein [Sphingomonas sp. CFBP9021]USQ99442.1 histidine phosphotransferase family protein [Sphingomonas aerolata]